jgi:hypothetical protein
VKKVVVDDNSLFRSLAILLENISYYLLLRYLIAMQKQSYVVLSGIRTSDEITQAVH